MKAFMIAAMIFTPIPATPADGCFQFDRGSKEWYTCVSATLVPPTSQPPPKAIR